MLGFDAEERLIQKLPHDFAEKVVWGSRYPQHDTTSAHDAIGMLARADVPEDIIARVMGGNAAAQFNVEQLERVASRHPPLTSLDVPEKGEWRTNDASQLVAVRCGYRPLSERDEGQADECVFLGPAVQSPAVPSGHCCPTT